MRNRYPRPGHKVMKKFKLLRSEMYRLTRLTNNAPCRIQFDTSNLNRLVVGGMRSLSSTQHSSYTSRQLADMEWLGDIVIRTRIERPHFIILTISHRQHQNRQTWRQTTHLPARLNASHAWHIDVHKCGVIPNRVEKRQRLFTSSCFSNVKAEYSKCCPHRMANKRLVLYK